MSVGLVGSVDDAAVSRNTNRCKGMGDARSHVGLCVGEAVQVALAGASSGS